MEGVELYNSLPGEDNMEDDVQLRNSSLPLKVDHSKSEVRHARYKSGI